MAPVLLSEVQALLGTASTNVSWCIASSDLACEPNVAIP